jgi:drug/metabolite transporter (DMT)-like permease
MHPRPHATATHRGGSIALAIGVFAIGWSAIFVRWSGVSGMVSAFYRLFIAAIVLAPWYLFTAKRRARPTAAAKRTAILTGIVFAADLAFFNSAIMSTSAANATLLGVNAPIFVVIGAWLLYGEHPPARFWLGFFVALAGMVAIVGADVVLRPSFGFGDFLALLGALCYGIYLLYVQRGRTGMDTLTFSLWCVSSGAVALLITCLVAHQPLWGFSGKSWASLIALALATQVGGHVLITYALGHLPVTITSIVLLAQAPITAVLAWPLLGERVGISQLVGGLMVLAGIVLVNVQRASAADVSTAAKAA